MSILKERIVKFRDLSTDIIYSTDRRLFMVLSQNTLIFTNDGIILLKCPLNGRTTLICRRLQMYGEYLGSVKFRVHFDTFDSKTRVLTVLRQMSVPVSDAVESQESSAPLFSQDNAKKVSQSSLFSLSQNAKELPSRRNSVGESPTISQRSEPLSISQISSSSSSTCYSSGLKDIFMDTTPKRIVPRTPIIGGSQSVNLNKGVASILQTVSFSQDSIAQTRRPTDTTNFQKLNNRSESSPISVFGQESNYFRRDLKRPNSNSTHQGDSNLSISLCETLNESMFSQTQLDKTVETNSKILSNIEPPKAKRLPIWKVPQTQSVFAKPHTPECVVNTSKCIPVKNSSENSAISACGLEPNYSRKELKRIDSKLSHHGDSNLSISLSETLNESMFSQTLLNKIVDNSNNCILANINSKNPSPSMALSGNTEMPMLSQSQLENTRTKRTCNDASANLINSNKGLSVVSLEPQKIPGDVRKEVTEKKTNRPKVTAKGSIFSEMPQIIENARKSCQSKKKSVDNKQLTFAQLSKNPLKFKCIVAALMVSSEFVKLVDCMQKILIEYEQPEAKSTQTQIDDEDNEYLRTRTPITDKNENVSARSSLNVNLVKESEDCALPLAKSKKQPKNTDRQIVVNKKTDRQMVVNKKNPKPRKLDKDKTGKGNESLRKEKFRCRDSLSPDPKVEQQITKRSTVPRTCRLPKHKKDEPDPEPDRIELLKASTSKRSCPKNNKPAATKNKENPKSVEKKNTRRSSRIEKNKRHQL